MNPFSVIEKWISEHGSAATLRDHVALLKEKMAGLEAKVRSLEKQVSDLTSERDEAQAEVKKLKEQIAKCNRRKKYVFRSDRTLHSITSEQEHSGDA
jgi:uncharacterized coiled-coil DUF342 family protein